MKKLILLSFALLKFLSLFSDFTPITNQASKDISSKKGLGLKRINAYGFLPNGKDSILRQVVLFDELGRVHTNMILDNEGKHITLKYEIKYLANTALVYSVKTMVFQDIAKTGALSVYFEYDSLGRVLKQFTFNEDTTDIMAETFYYGPNIQPLRSTLKYNMGKSFVRHIYYYDNLSRLKKTETYNEYRELIYSDTTEYSGNTEYLYHVIREEKVLQKTSEYEGKVLIKTIDPDTKLHNDLETFYYYDKDGFPDEQEIKLQNKLLLRVRFVYIYK